MAAVGDKYGPYTCVRRLGEGGMAETFLALQSGPHGFEQRVCIKIVRENCKALSKFVEAFIAEATIAASLRHSNIVSVIDASQQYGYMVLELVDGVDLRTLAQSVPTHRLAPDLVSYLALELVKALEFAHRRRLHGKIDGVVHRDVKPSNVLVSYAGEVKLADFGVAKAIRSTGDSDGLIRGTPSYMSPEQAEGKPLDARSDLFSLGILLYEMLAGRRPFDGNDDLDTVRRICQGELQPLAVAAPDVPAGLAAVVEKLLASSPERRFVSARELGSALDRFAPPPNTYRRLGALARESRPPETLVLSDDENAPALSLPVSAFSSPGEAQTGKADSAYVVPPSSGSVPRGSPSGAPLPETVSLMADANVGIGPLGANAGTWPLKPARSSPAAAPGRGAIPIEGSLDLDEIGRPRLFGSVRPRPVIALAVSVAVFALMLAVLYTRHGFPSSASSLVELVASTVSSPTPVESGPSSTPSTSPIVDSQPALPDLSENKKDTPSESTPADTSTDEIPTPESSADEALSRTSRKPSVPAVHRNRRPSAGKNPAHIAVGVFPWGNVWIDGAAKGKAPFRAKLPPGRHTVAGGKKTPEVSRRVRLRPGFTTQVVINVTTKTLNATHEPSGR